MPKSVPKRQGNELEEKMKTMLQEHKKMKMEIDKLKTEVTYVGEMVESLVEQTHHITVYVYESTDRHNERPFHPNIGKGIIDFLEEKLNMNYDSPDTDTTIYISERDADDDDWHVVKYGDKFMESQDGMEINVVYV